MPNAITFLKGDHASGIVNALVHILSCLATYTYHTLTLSTTEVEDGF